MPSQTTLDAMLPAHAQRARELEAAGSPPRAAAMHQTTLGDFAGIAAALAQCSACGRTEAAPVDLVGAPLLPKCGHALCLTCIQGLQYHHCPVCEARLTKNLWNGIGAFPLVRPAAPPAQHAVRLVELTEEKCEEWRKEPGLGVKFLDNHVGSDLMEMSVNGTTVACVVIRTQSEDTRVLDILVRKSARGKGYGKQIMLHVCKELFPLDAVQMLQFNVICRGQKRAALAKIVKYCVKQIDGVTGGEVRGQDTWMMMREGKQ